MNEFSSEMEETLTGVFLKHGGECAEPSCQGKLPVFSFKGAAGRVPKSAEVGWGC